jgi:hypothetical protein
MKRTSKGASAPAFLVITSHRTCTECIGTKEQLLAVYPDLKTRFLDGKRYVRYGSDYYITGKKGGLYKVRKFHAEPAKTKADHVYLEVPLNEVNGYGTPQWKCHADKVLKDKKGFSSGYTYRDLAEASRLIASALNRELDQSRRERLTLVHPGQTAATETPAPIRGRRGRE